MRYQKIFGSSIVYRSSSHRAILIVRIAEIRITRDEHLGRISNAAQICTFCGEFEYGDKMLVWICCVDKYMLWISSLKYYIHIIYKSYHSVNLQGAANFQNIHPHRPE